MVPRSSETDSRSLPRVEATLALLYEDDALEHGRELDISVTLTRLSNFGEHHQKISRGIRFAGVDDGISTASSPSLGINTFDIRRTGWSGDAVRAQVMESGKIPKRSREKNDKKKVEGYRLEAACSRRRSCSER